jgi:3-deoxy-D-manno-octulosonic-acid transferase
MKFDAVAQPPSQERVDRIRRTWLLPEGAPLIVGGSTHEGEERALLQSFSRILVEQPDTWLLLAPRHPERFNEVESLIRAQGFNALRRSRCAEVSRPPDPRTVLLLDTIGELAQVYALSAVSFVGGSLANIGGHNIIEPASAGKPVLFGPHMHHFQNIQDAFLSERAAIRVASEEDLCRQMCHLLKNPPEAEAVGKAAARVVKNNKGATARYFDLIKDFLRDG